MQNECQVWWDRCLAAIKDILPEDSYKTWFVPIKPFSYEENALTLQVPSKWFVDYLEANYVDLLKDAIYRVLGKGTQLNYRIAPTSPAPLQPEEKTTTSVQTSLLGASTALQPAKSLAQELDAQLNPLYSFDNYIEGISNKLVRAAGEAIAQNPGKTAFNPLFVFGPSGVGKTHLCHAIGRRIRELHPAKRVLYVSANTFRMQYVDAARNGKTDDFLRFYQNIDVLIMDDVQEFVGMTKTQNSFFHVFNHMHQLGKQLILTSDKPPVDLQGLEDRLITRLKWGLTAEMDRPDLELRKKILRNRIVHEEMIVSEDVFNFIVDNVTNNVRDLEGILTTLVANALMGKKEIDMPLTKRVVGQTVKVEVKEITIKSIQNTVCLYFNLEEAAIQGKSRKSEISTARQIIMFLAKKYTESSFANIGKEVGKRDHATVLHACKTVKDQMETNKVFRVKVQEIEEKLKV